MNEKTATKRRQVKRLQVLHLPDVSLGRCSSVQKQVSLCSFSLYIYINTSRFPCSKNMSWSVTLSIGKSSTGISPTGGMVTGKWHITI